MYLNIDMKPIISRLEKASALAFERLENEKEMHPNVTEQIEELLNMIHKQHINEVEQAIITQFYSGLKHSTDDELGSHLIEILSNSTKR